MAGLARALAVRRENSDEFAGATGLAWPGYGGMIRTVVGADMVGNGAVRAGGVGGSERAALRLGGVGGAERAVRGVRAGGWAARGAGGSERVARGVGGTGGVGGSERVARGVGGTGG